MDSVSSQKHRTGPLCELRRDCTWRLPYSFIALGLESQTTLHKKMCSDGRLTPDGGERTGCIQAQRKKRELERSLGTWSLRLVTVVHARSEFWKLHREFRFLHRGRHPVRLVRGTRSYFESNGSCLRARTLYSRDSRRECSSSGPHQFDVRVRNEVSARCKEDPRIDSLIPPLLHHRSFMFFVSSFFRVLF